MRSLACLVNCEGKLAAALRTLIPVTLIVAENRTAPVHAITADDSGEGVTNPFMVTGPFTISINFKLTGAAPSSRPRAGVP